MSISLDGFVAGTDQCEDNPLGVEGIELHRWHLDDSKHTMAETARWVLHHYVTAVEAVASGAGTRLSWVRL